MTIRERYSEEYGYLQTLLQHEDALKYELERIQIERQAQSDLVADLCEKLDMPVTTCECDVFCECAD